MVYFNMLEKDTNSQLNQINFAEIGFRDQRVYIANLYRQDTFVKGYTLQFSTLYNDDQPSTFEWKPISSAPLAARRSHSAPRSVGLFRRQRRRAFRAVERHELFLSGDRTRHVQRAGQPA